MTAGALGFTRLEVGAPVSSPLTIGNVIAGINRAATERGITLAEPSDAADLSRDIIIDEAVWPLGGRWAIDGDTLRVWPRELGDAWPFTKEA